MRLAALLLLIAVPAHAYEENVHALLEARALDPELRATPVAPPTVEDADALAAAIWKVGAAHPDADLRRRFLARYPTAFDRWSFKEFLALAPEAQVFGIDRMPTGATAGALLVVGAREPDEDRRNQERFAHDAQRRPLVDRYGEQVPLDPAQLDMGALHGISSQAYAHYGLWRGPRTDETDVLKKEPWRWSYPPTAQTFAPEFAQEFTDLALCATALGKPGLGYLYLGQADHYIGDVANQIHTVQAVYGFFYDAKIESYKEELRSLGGLLRSRPDFVTIGVGIITNHHLLSEDLWSKRVLGGKQPAAVAAIAAGDAAFEKALDGAEDARAIAEATIAASAPEGGAVYDTIRELALPALSRVGGNFDDGMNPDAFLRPDPPAGAVEKFARLETAGFARAGSALRRHARLFAAARPDFESVAQRLIRTQLDALDAADARRAHYEPKPPRVERMNWLVPGTLAVLLLAVGSAAIWILRRRRRNVKPA